MMTENEIEFIDILNVIWKRKWLIIVPTVLIAVLVGVISFLLPPKWAVDTIVEPAKFLSKAPSGNYLEIIATEPKQLAEQVDKATYNHTIAAELNIDIKKFPKLKAENIEKTKLVHISTVDKDVEKAKLILNTLFNIIKKDMDTKADIELKEIDAEINSNEIEKMKVEDEIKTDKKKLGIVRQRIKEVEIEMKDLGNRLRKLEEEQLASLRKERNEAESLGMLLYANEIQYSLRFQNSLNEMMSLKKLEEEDLNLDIENGEKKIEMLENTINNLKQVKGRIDFTKLVKEPTSSLSPVSPKKKFNILIAGVLSLVLLTIFVFFLEYYEKQKRRE